MIDGGISFKLAKEEFAVSEFELMEMDRNERLVLDQFLKTAFPPFEIFQSRDDRAQALLIRIKYPVPVITTL